MGTLQLLAETLDADERTLRRAIELGTVRHLRPSPRRLGIEPDEWDYLNSHWPLLRRLKALLRTEPRVRFAALIGSVARGDERRDSDLDLVVQFAKRDVRSRHRIERRVEREAGRITQLLHLDDVERAPSMLMELLRDGRVIVDRDGAWKRLRLNAAQTEQAAEDEFAHRMAEARDAARRIETHRTHA